MARDAAAAAASSDEKQQSASNTATSTTRDVGASKLGDDDDRVMGDRSRAWQELKGEDAVDDMERRTTRSGSADEIPIEMAAVGGMGNYATATATTSKTDAPQRRVSGATDDAAAEAGGDAVQYKVYKRRWFGLVQLALLNVIVSWDVSAVFSIPSVWVVSHVGGGRVDGGLGVCPILSRGGSTPSYTSAMHKSTPQCRSIPSPHSLTHSLTTNNTSLTTMTLPSGSPSRPSPAMRPPTSTRPRPPSTG